MSNSGAIPVLSAGGNQLGVAASNVDAPTIANGIQTMSFSYLFDGSTQQRQRTPAVFKSAAFGGGGSGALWTPAAGKKFRLMGYEITLTEDATLAVAADISVTLRDVAATIGLRHDLFVPAIAVAGIGGFTTGWIPLGNGYLSTAANNVLNVNFSGAALVTGTWTVLGIGTEE